MKWPPQIPRETKMATSEKKQAKDLKRHLNIVAPPFLSLARLTQKAHTRQTAYKNLVHFNDIRFQLTVRSDGG